MKFITTARSALIVLLGATCATVPALAQTRNVPPLPDRVIRLEYSPAANDYSGIITDAMKRLYAEGGGTLEIPYGQYPLTRQVLFTEKGKPVSLAIRGTKNPAGEAPILFCVAEPLKTHRMFNLDTDVALSISSLEIQGNNVPVNRAATNVPWDKGINPEIDLPTGKAGLTNLPPDKTYGHPYLYHEDKDGDAISTRGLDTLRVDDVVIRDIYGTGISILARGSLPNDYVRSPSITNTKILNTWQWQEGFMNGDGIYCGFAKNPRIENCVVYNDISYTRWIGRIGVTLEYDTQDAVIRNNLIGGYNSDVHIENTLGGHQVIGNKLLAAVTAVTLNEPDYPKGLSDYAYRMATIKPILIKDNVMEYRFERQKYKTSGYGGRRAFVDFSVPSEKLKGTEITGNFMTYQVLPGDNAPITTANFVTDIFQIKDLVVKGNQFIGIDGAGRETIIGGGNSAVWPPLKGNR